MEGVSHRNPIEHFDHFLFVADQCFALVRAQLLPLVSTPMLANIPQRALVSVTIWLSAVSVIATNFARKNENSRRSVTCMC